MASDHIICAIVLTKYDKNGRIWFVICVGGALYWCHPLITDRVP